MPKEYKTQFYDGCHKIGIMIEFNGKRKVFPARIKHKHAEELQDFFHERGEYDKEKSLFTIEK